MKKVYGSLKLVVLVCVFFYLPLDVCIRAHKFSDFNLSWLILAAFIIFIVATLMFSFTSSWAYGEKGIEIKNMRGEVLKKYSWNDVLRISRRSSTKGLSWISLDLNDGKQIVIWYFSTRNYLIVLSDVVHCLQKINPKAYVDQRILKKVREF